MEEFKIAEEVAITELKTFIEYHLDETIDESQVAKDYKEVLKAMQRGLLNVSDMDAPVLTLKTPVKTESGTVDQDHITFLTRIPKSKLASLSKGFDIIKNPIGFANVLTAYLIQQPAVAMLDKYGKADIKVIDQLTGLFQ
jgi:hypothetical protein